MLSKKRVYSSPTNIYSHSISGFIGLFGVGLSGLEGGCFVIGFFVYLVLDTQADLICFMAELWQNISYKNLHILFPKK